MRQPFVESVLKTLIADGVLSRSDSLLAICAGPAERDVFVRLGLTNAVISNVDERMSEDQFAPIRWSHQDATNLSFDDDSFDFALVADGLHHTSAPHRGVLEMYRVARRGIIVIESRHNLFVQLAKRLGLSAEYEVAAVIGNDFRNGGLNNTEIPNYVYRWTETEFAKTIRSFNPVGDHTFRFFYALNLPYGGAETSNLKLRVLRLTEPVLNALTRIFKKQSNSFAMVALKPRIPEDLWPWLTLENGRVRFNRTYAERRFKFRAATRRECATPVPGR
jgi:SAM-dependent methyltransferase